MIDIVFLHFLIVRPERDANLFVAGLSEAVHADEYPVRFPRL